MELIAERSRLERIAQEELARVVFEEPLAELDRRRFLGTAAAAGVVSRFLQAELAIGREEHDGGRVESVEWSFEGFDAAGDGDAPVLIAGRIDRLDRLRRRYAFVIDYKTTTRLPELAEAVAAGLHLQLPLYLLAVRRQAPSELTVAGGALYGVTPEHAGITAHLTDDSKGRFYGRRKAVPAERYEELLERARSLALEAASGIRAGRFPVTRHAADEAGCGRCDFRSVCRQPGDGGGAGP